MRKTRLLAILAIGERSRGYAINGTRQTTIAYDTYGRIATMCMAEGRSGVLTASNENEFVWSYLPNTDARMGVISPDPHAPDSSNPNTQSETIKLSPCDYDIAAFTTCVLSAKDEYFDWTFWSNCGDFVDGTVARCKSASERK